VPGGQARFASERPQQPNRDELVTADGRKAWNARGTHPWVRFIPEQWDTGDR
jgi:hypothetical protein